MPKGNNKPLPVIKSTNHQRKSIAFHWEKVQFHKISDDIWRHYATMRATHIDLWGWPWERGSWGQHRADLGPTGPRWAPCWPHELCYLGPFSNLYTWYTEFTSHKIHGTVYSISMSLLCDFTECHNNPNQCIMIYTIWISIFFVEP